ncbi:hypothetical protein BDV25DRAFT_169167 [Aspergillus avenaceus]|uniref:Zn(2)-C6 fungal-type domain-containing protein n=1 Tax=Aspergillus avenaceus TaxID=36643 RepID=A0A5N6U3R4_ASPAV|nr:hypothetical protein BDV25DRAFT_169167 [Aspergillus avenaceus]
MRSRRFHRKSRTGCISCRSRRIKCNESHPICGQCERASIPCHYSTVSRPSASTLTVPREPHPSLLDHRAIPEGRPQFDLLDITLMHHYTFATAASLFGGEHTDLWQREVPLQAQSNPLLMHGILATAALHLAVLEPTQSSPYWTRALHHHNLGLELYNAQIAHLNSENCQALLTFGIYLVVWAYASPTITRDLLNLDRVLDSLELVRGCRIVFELQSAAILEQPIGKFITEDSHAAPGEVSPTALQAFRCLRKKVDDFSNTLAIDRLERFWEGAHATSSPMRHAMGWPAMIEGSFWHQVRKHRPVALLTFMHYAMLLGHFNLSTWWVKGWSDGLIKAVEDVLTESEKGELEWDMHATWVRSQIVQT